MKISIYCDNALVAQSPEVVGYVSDGTKCTAVWFGGIVEGVATNDAGDEYAWARHWDVTVQVPAGYRLTREVCRYIDKSIPPDAYPPDDRDSSENVLGPGSHHSGDGGYIDEIYDWWKIWDPGEEDVLSRDCEVTYYFEKAVVAPGIILRDPVSGKILRGGPNSQILRTPGSAQSGSSDQ